MARTYLLRKLQQACRILARASTANAENVSTPPRGTQPLTRRTFLHASAAIGLAAAVGHRVADTAVAADYPRIVIVGAGLAGLTCAYRLKQAGIYAEICEASRRVGGRCFTGRGLFEEDQIIERGGELINSDHEALLGWIEELGLEVDDLHEAQPEGSRPLLYFDGEPYTFDGALADFQQVWPKLMADTEEADYPIRYDYATRRARQLDRMSIVEWIEESVPGGMGSRFGRLLAVAYTAEFGAEPEDQSSLNLINMIGYSDSEEDLTILGPSDERYHVRGGNDLVVSRLANHLKEQIHLGQRLVEIRRHLGPNRYLLTFQNGEETQRLIADYVVLALPFSILRHEVNYQQAGFRGRKRQAIEELGMGSNVKMHLQFSHRAWLEQGCDGQTATDTGYQSSWEVTRAQPGASGILVNFSGGDYARSFSSGSPTERAEQFLSMIEPVLPGLAEFWNERATVEYWPGNRWTRGSYSYYKVGQYTRFAGVEAEPEGNCFFCGEHTSLEYQGYLNGAVDSGERAAVEVLEAFAQGRHRRG